MSSFLSVISVVMETCFIKVSIMLVIKTLIIDFEIADFLNVVWGHTTTLAFFFFFCKRRAVAHLLPLSLWFSGPQSSWEPHLAESSSSRNLWWPGYGDWGGGRTEDQRSFISHVFCAFALHSALSVWTLSSVPPHRSDWTEEHRQYLLHERSSPGAFQLVRTPIMSSLSV